MSPLIIAVRPHVSKSSALLRGSSIGSTNLPDEEEGKMMVFVLSCSVISSSLRPHMDCSLPGSSVYGILQARILEWVAISFSQNGWYYNIIQGGWLWCANTVPVTFVSLSPLKFTWVSSPLGISMYMTFCKQFQRVHVYPPSLSIGLRLKVLQDAMVMIYTQYIK